MTDVFTKQKRSDIMSRVRSRGNVLTERRLATLLRQANITGWRRHSQLCGRPDFVFARERIAVFVDGCFWHGCPTHAETPKTNANWWAAKLAKNRRRDRLVDQELRKRKWRVIRVWQCQLSVKSQPNTIRRIQRALASVRSPIVRSKEATDRD
jgi:DNA mismatch endonuclease (patch repair protein)